MINRMLFSVTLFLWGFISLLIYFNILNVDHSLITSIIIIAYGLSSSNLAFKEGNRLQLVVSSVIFFIGIIILIKTNYVIIDSRGLIFVSIFLITGAVSILLYIENTNQKIFLYSGLIVFCIGIFFLLFIEKLGMLYLINQAARLFENYFPFLLIILGLIIFLKREKH